MWVRDGLGAGEGAEGQFGLVDAVAGVDVDAVGGGEGDAGGGGVAGAGGQLGEVVECGVGRGTGRMTQSGNPVAVEAFETQDIRCA